jgi:two-component system, LuxR family, response regulator FixJ
LTPPTIRAYASGASLPRTTDAVPGAAAGEPRDDKPFNMGLAARTPGRIGGVCGQSSLQERSDRNRESAVSRGHVRRRDDVRAGGERMTQTPLAHVIDDSAELRSALQLLLKSVSIDVRTYASADDFLAMLGGLSDRPSCVLLDVRMPGMSGMALLERLRTDYPALPVIVMTGHGDIDMAVRAMKLGAVDFVTKPFSSQTLLDLVQNVLRRSSGQRETQVSPSDASARWATLTAREREIFERIVSGDSNKVIAYDLGISIRTVESHRARIMEKMNAKTLVDLVLLSVSLRSAAPGP